MQEGQLAGHAWRAIAWLLPMAAMALVIAYFSSRPPPAAIAFEASGRALIVLPLRAASAQAEEGALARGFSVELIGRLATIRDLRVIARESSRRAAADHLDDQQLAQRLGVTHVLSGSLRSQAARVYADVHLTEIASGRVLLAHVYERAIDEMPSLGQDIALDVARSLGALIPATPDAARVEPDAYRSYCEAQQFIDDYEPARAIELLRGLVAKAPKFAQARGVLARALVRERRDQANAELDEAADEALRAQELDPNLADAQVALAVLACRTADWSRCIGPFPRALALDPADSESRITFAYWLGALGFVDQALREAENAWRVDPLSSAANFTRGRMLDTIGRHAEAQRYLDAPSVQAASATYARWHNAIWRKDLNAAPKIAVAIPRSEGFREAYLVVSEALIEPQLWPQVLPLISTSERATGRIDVLRLLTPNPDYAVIMTGLERMLRNGWPSYYLLLWMPEYAALRRDPAFQDFLRRTRIIDYWRASGWPPQCHAEGEGARCD